MKPAATRHRCRRGDETGTITAWTAGIAFSCIALVGWAADMGMALRHRSEAFGLAAAAARVGGQQLDERHLLTRENDCDLVIDQDAAEAAVEDFLEDQHSESLVERAEVDFPADDQITVTVHGETRLRVLGGLDGWLGFDFPPIGFDVGATVDAVQVGEGGCGAGADGAAGADRGGGS